MKLSYYPILFLLLLLNLNISQAEEIKHKDFTIVYDTPDLKYYATILKEYMVNGMIQLETTSGLKFKKKILVSLYKESDALLNQNKIKNSEDILLRLDSDTTLTLIITPPIGYNSTNPFPIFLQKKLFYILFRQNKLPENVWFEEAFFEIVLNEINSFGLISVAELKSFFPFNTEKLDYFKSKTWESARDIPNTPENIKLSFEKINFAKTILLYQLHELTEKDPKKTTKLCKIYVQKLKQNKPWLENLSFVPDEDFIKQIIKKRDLYAKMMVNFNAPGSDAFQNITQDYLFRMILRLLIKKQTDLAYQLFKAIEITPTANPYFSELGLFFSKKYKTDRGIWLEYFLLNQNENKPVDFDIPDQVSILLQETLSKEMPDFQVSDQELDFIRTIQFLLYLGKKELLAELLAKNKDYLHNLEIKNLIWGFGFLINDKKIIKDYEENIEFYKSRTWNEIKALH